MPVKGEPLADSHRQAIKEACLKSEAHRKSVSRPKSIEWRAALAASARVSRVEEPEKWQTLYDEALSFLAARDAMKKTAAVVNSN